MCWGDDMHAETTKACSGSRNSSAWAAVAVIAANTPHANTSQAARTARRIPQLIMLVSLGLRYSVALARGDQNTDILRPQKQQSVPSCSPTGCITTETA